MSNTVAGICLASLVGVMVAVWTKGTPECSRILSSSGNGLKMSLQTILEQVCEISQNVKWNREY